MKFQKSIETAFPLLLGAIVLLHFSTAEARFKRKKMQSFNISLITGLALPSFESNEILSSACPTLECSPDDTIAISDTFLNETIDDAPTLGLGFRLGYDLVVSRRFPLYISPEIVGYYSASDFRMDSGYNGQLIFKANEKGVQFPLLDSTVSTGIATFGARFGYAATPWFTPTFAFGLGYGFMGYDAALHDDFFGGFAWTIALGMEFKVANWLEIGPQFKYSAFSFEHSDTQMRNNEPLPTPIGTFTGDISVMSFDLVTKFSL